MESMEGMISFVFDCTTDFFFLVSHLRDTDHNYRQTNTAELPTQQQRHGESIQPARTGQTDGHEKRTPAVHPERSQFSGKTGDESTLFS